MIAQAIFDTGIKFENLEGKFAGSQASLCEVPCQTLYVQVWA